MVPYSPAATARHRLAFWISTWFGAGLLPVAPGSWGALAALPLTAILATLGGAPLVLAGALVVLVVGLWASEAYVRATGRDDPQEVVVDEVFGQCLTLAFVPVSPWAYLLGFVLFRVIDILKFWPCSSIHRRLGGGAGVMVDDLVAAIYAGAILYGVVLWWPP